ncbi:pPIWI_RE module domain-containing protein [Goodfellowiella coeruleoviolacea]|uniref:DUF3893 domain-containing protein n=1 Tax=Goodfellowiella coeruleoviolacea TaxID=334858 RepID=A0AAE3GF51_9PSEU|nr:DUF3962 domain-containing protein [Goodfellowiella coeruleoviolacea]MCP2167126.1 protein of unknown function (DUF3893) [Goodfellowiella coeruleoviolacea]
MKYDKITLAAYQPSGEQWLNTFRTIRFGDDWRDEALALHRLGRERVNDPTTLPIDQLNKLFRTVAPGVVATARGAATDSSTPWLYAEHDVPVDLVAAVVNTWAFTLGPHRPNLDPSRRLEIEESILKVATALSTSIPNWEDEVVDLTASGLSRGGTAVPDRRLYQLLPEVLAAHLASRPSVLKGRGSHFRVVTRGQGTELVSWPPESSRRKRRDWFYSLVIGITVQTVPFSPMFRVHVTTGIRRWITDPVFIPGGRGVQALLAIDPPWLNGQRHTPRMSGNFLIRDGANGAARWRRGSLAVLLPQLDIMRQYPSAAKVVANPGVWLAGVGGVQAGVVYRNGLVDHEIETGVGPDERAELDRWVEDNLRPWFRRTPDMVRTGHAAKPALRVEKRLSSEESRAALDRRMAPERRAALARALDGAPLKVDIHWQTERTRDELVAALCALLDLPNPDFGAQGDATWMWTGDGITIEVMCREFDVTAASALAGAKKGTDRRKHLTAEIKHRRALVRGLFERDLDPAREAGVVFVELHGEDSFVATGTDPKTAIRLGCASAGRLSQFIERLDDGEGLAHRARMACLDGLRQLGAVTTAPPRLSGLPEGTRMVGMWTARRRARDVTRYAHRELVVVRVEPRDGHYQVEGWHDGQKRWLPYRQYLLSMPEVAAVRPSVERRSTNVLKDGQASTQRRIRSVLYQLRDRPTALMVNSENMRLWWPGIRNSELERDMVAFGAEPPQRLAVLGSDLRLILIRTGGSRTEVPQWYAMTPDHDAAGFSAEIWRSGQSVIDERVFASTAEVPHTVKGMNRRTRKLLPNGTNATTPAKRMWNPRYVEITVAGCLSSTALAAAGRTGEPDDPATWAALAHQQRYVDDYVPLAQPAVLHWAKLVEEYVLPTEPF